MLVGENEHFGIIRFTVGVDVTPAFKQAVAALPESAWRAGRRRRTEDRCTRSHREKGIGAWMTHWSGNPLRFSWPTGAGG